MVQYHILNKIKEKDHYESIVYTLCGLSCTFWNYHKQLDFQRDVSFFMPFGIMRVTRFKDNVECDECILLALALEAEYDYDRRDKTEVWTAPDWRINE